MNKQTLLRYTVILGVGLSAVLLYLLAGASANTSFFAEHYSLLLTLNGALVVGLLLLVSYQVWELARKLRGRVFGAKLAFRLLLLFGLMAVIPGAIIYAVSVQFLSKSIESWFDVRVDKGLEGGLSLGRSAMATQLKDLEGKGRSMAQALSDIPPAEHVIAINRLREQFGIQEAALFTQRGGLLAFAGGERASLVPDLPSPAILRQARQAQEYSGIEPASESGYVLRVVLPVSMLSLQAETRYLQVLQPVPAQLAQDADAVQDVYRDYQQLALSHGALNKLYALTLTMTLLLALLSALLSAFLLSERLSAPLGLLAEGTRAVARGDFSQRHPVTSQDEIGILTESFNTMTDQLAEARSAARETQAKVEEANAYLESVLANLSAGVIEFDGGFRLRSANRSATEILQLDFAPLLQKSLSELGAVNPALQAFADEVLAAFESAGVQEWEKQIERPVRGLKQVLLVRGTRLPGGSAAGSVVVFDDITHLLQAQRDAAWGEVARRLAHEIKNPLTPIQLSAERLEHKLADKLAHIDRQVLSNATQTIVKQVAAMKKMVDSFSQYARAPGHSLQTFDLNRLVTEVLGLYEALGPAIKMDLAETLPQISGDQTLLRQVMHNLLQNAQDALASVEAPEIVVRTEAAGDAVRLSILDNGSGFPDNLLPRVFEPYVTTKPRGTGLGLAIVKKIVEQHHGSVEVANLRPHGAQVSILLPAAARQKAAAA